MSLPAVSRYNPLARVLCADDFDRGHNGWLDLRPNFVKPGYRAQSDEVDLVHWGPTMISSASFPRAGTHGSMSGTYSLKLSTRPNAAPADERPAPGGMGIALKRLSQPGPIERLKLEAWLTYIPEDDREGFADKDVRAFGCFVDLQTGGNRWQPGVRYVNSIGGTPVRRWQWFGVSPSATDASWSYGQEGWHVRGIDTQWYGTRHADGSSEGYQWVDAEPRAAVSNESDDKINWMYFALTVDVANRSYESLYFVDREYDLRGLAPEYAKPYAGLDGLINPVFFVETDTDRRAFLFIDSVVLSVC